MVIYFQNPENTATNAPTREFYLNSIILEVCCNGISPKSNRINLVTFDSKTKCYVKFLCI